MIVRMGLLRKRPDLSTTDFRRHWREVHGPLAAKMPGLRAYHQNHIVDKSQLAIDHARGGWDLDGFSELWFDDVATMERAIASEAYQAVVADSPHCMAATRVIVANQVTVVPLQGRPAIKRMSVLQRRADISAEDFRREWLDVHAPLVARFPAIAGYRQNVVTACGPAPGIDADADGLAPDGIVEMWFHNQQDLVAAFQSPAAELSQRHALSFLQTITTFLVDVHELV
ncbi:EthD domain-containing protein [Bradyrhizobium sp. 2TAF24]|uniref:EthD domain-containing protein n=1 Tax=Bradyrhizobium sp. 2TAF24 TaxID=3233011 RepID=UPI003F93246B